MTETPNPHIVDTDTLTGEMRPIRRAVLALGSNLGERMASLQGAVNAIADTPDVWVTGVSPVYETEPVDSPPEAKNYLNAVVLVDTTLAASRLMDRALAIEDAFGLFGGLSLSGTGGFGAPGANLIYPVPPGLLTGWLLSFQAVGFDPVTGLFVSNCEQAQF